MTKLSGKQALFVVEYLKDLNATQAAIRSGYSKRTAVLIGHQNLKKPKIQTAIQQDQAIRAKKSGVNPQWVLDRLIRLADFNIKKFIKIDSEGNAIYDFKNVTDEDWYCISVYTYDKLYKKESSNENVYSVQNVKLKHLDKLKALELIGKHINIKCFSEKVELGGGVRVYNCKP